MSGSSRRIASLVMFVTALSGTAIAEQVARPMALVVTHEPATIVVGAPFTIDVQAREPLLSLKGSWLGREVFFEFEAQRGRWIAFAGASLDTKPGAHPLLLSGSSRSGVEFTQSVTLDVAHAAYASSALRVARKFTEPDAETAARIAREQALKKEVLGALTSRRQWSGNFMAPIDSVTTEPFGTQRTFNGAVQSVHQGLDYRASEGTPVRAANSGTVILARDLFFEGNCVVIDHGQGLLSLYFHLSSMAIKEGDPVERGQMVGHSGGTGRVTGPHLHLAIRWQGAYLDPARLLKLSLN
jgi:murein DD-endopeptidase MepM/ murein hydrolase activator NlpD